MMKFKINNDFIVSGKQGYLYIIPAINKYDDNELPTHRISS